MTILEIPDDWMAHEYAGHRRFAFGNAVASDAANGIGATRASADTPLHDACGDPGSPHHKQQKAWFVSGILVKCRRNERSEKSTGNYAGQWTKHKRK